MSSNNTYTFERVDPKTAELWLNQNLGNRSLREGVAERYTADMVNGTWTECLAPIAFYDDGSLADGQHRLWAVVQSATTQNFIIVRNLPRTVALNIDMGIPRTLVDNAHISGDDPELTNSLLAITRAIEDGVRNIGKANSRTNTDRIAIVAKHREAAMFAIRHRAQTKHIGSAPVLAAIGRAWYMEADKERLAHFCKVLDKGFADGKQDAAAVAMRNQLLAMAEKKISVTSRPDIWRDVFLRVQNAIRYFMLNKPLVVIKPVSDEQYPLPGRRRAATTDRGKRAQAKTERRGKHEARTEA